MAPVEHVILKQLDLKEFDLTEEHIKLLKRMSVCWSHVEYGAPVIDSKRPYGNSDVVGDIHDILSWPIGESYDMDEDYDHDKARKIHEEMAIVLEIAIHNPGIDLIGGWERDWPKSNWGKVSKASRNCQLDQ